MNFCFTEVAIGAIVYFLVLGLLFWLARQLGLEPVRAAIAKAGVKRRDVRYAVAAGVGLAVLLGIAIRSSATANRRNGPRQ